MRSKAVGVLELCIAGYLNVSHFERPGFSRLDQRSADTSTLPGWLDVPTLDEGHR
jgi:hypothetical protein